MKRKLIIVLLALLPLGVISFTYINDNYFLIAKNLDIFTTLFKEVNAHYVDEIDPAALVTTGIDAMLESLDPYNDFIPESQLEDFRNATTGEYAGIGAVYSVIHDKVRITRLHEGFSAHRAGILLGDELISVDGKRVTPENIFDISKRLKGQINSMVEVTVVRTDGKIETIQIKRELITVGSVPYYGMLNEKTGYIKLEEFTVDAGKEVKNAVIELKEKGATNLVLDLRGNGGGLLTEAVSICNVFIERGKEIVSTLGQFEDLNMVQYAMNEPVDAQIPLVVLVDDESASASEVVSGVIQDYDRGLLIGRKTFGKGLVQTTRSLPYNSQLNVTTSKYYIPSGRCIQAIDYSSNDNSRIHDSLRVEFRTANGRKVFDGSGILPDILVKPYNYSPLAITLAYRGYLFEYAIKFKSEHPTISGAREFRLNDSQYQDFINWVEEQDFEYSTRVEMSLQEVEKTSKEEFYFNDLQKAIRDLEQKVGAIKGSDLTRFKDEISNLLNEEIVGTYYFYRGEIEASFTKDEDVKAALNALSDRSEYNRLLGY